MVEFENDDEFVDHVDLEVCVVVPVMAETEAWAENLARMHFAAGTESYIEKAGERSENLVFSEPRKCGAVYSHQQAILFAVRLFFAVSVEIDDNSPEAREERLGEIAEGHEDHTLLTMCRKKTAHRVVVSVFDKARDTDLWDYDCWRYPVDDRAVEKKTLLEIVG